MSNKAIAIKIGDRYFCRYKNKRIQTAWTLAGARLFQLTDRIELERIVNICSLKGKELTFVSVEETGIKEEDWSQDYAR